MKYLAPIIATIMSFVLAFVIVVSFGVLSSTASHAADSSDKIFKTLCTARTGSTWVENDKNVPKVPYTVKITTKYLPADGLIVPESARLFINFTQGSYITPPIWEIVHKGIPYITYRKSRIYFPDGLAVHDNFRSPTNTPYNAYMGLGQTKSLGGAPNTEGYIMNGDTTVTILSTKRYVYRTVYSGEIAGFRFPGQVSYQHDSLGKAGILTIRYKQDIARGANHMRVYEMPFYCTERFPSL